MTAVGLAGAHRTGKTTLAEEYAKKAGVEFVKTKTSQVFSEMGLNPGVDYPLDVRLAVQRNILKSYLQQYVNAKGSFIADRTPIDLMAYTLSDVRQETLTPEQDAELQKYLADCVEATNRFFAVLIVVQPGIAVVPAEGKASLAKSYIDHIAHLIMGIAVNEAIQCQRLYVPRNMTDIERRILSVEIAVSRSVEKHTEMLLVRAKDKNPVIFH